MNRFAESEEQSIKIILRFVKSRTSTKLQSKGFPFNINYEMETIFQVKIS